MAGEYNGVVSRPTWGRYEVDELYVELNAPLFASDPQRLDLSLAGRYSDYSTFGGETTGKAGFRWQVSESLLFRATYAQGFRAPAISELFGSAAIFDAVINDPCSGNVTANCRALGVPPGYVQPNPQISITTGGNPLLEPEEADSYSIGLVFSPELDAAWARRLDLGLSYYRHKLEGAIGPVDAQTQLNLCVAQGPGSPFCQGITRNPTGAIQEFNNRLQNLGRIETDGFDLSVGWGLPSFGFGEFDLALAHHLRRQLRQLRRPRGAPAAHGGHRGQRQRDSGAQLQS
ncbi:MAG: TonB-dependent receptor [Xanthomonadales bacterium]|nr:TonB-dependent receptor [Xanthomonadales bacterium]